MNSNYSKHDICNWSILYNRAGDVAFIWIMEKRQNKTYLILALATAVALLFHGASFFNTLEDTYDVYVHLFFADHYARSWFEPWEFRWYTGFSLISYPPLVHQSIALLSYIGGLKFGVYVFSFCIVLLYVTGAYRFSKLFTVNEVSAAYAALVAAFCPSVIEALHVFGQLPTVTGIAWLLHAIPEIYLWVRWGKIRYYFNSASLLAVAVASHHVTPIFGMVFFVLPVMATAVMDAAMAEHGSYKAIRIMDFIRMALRYFKRIFIMGLSSIFIVLLVILPYWIWSKSDPISQVPIPHGSRDSFIEVFSSGLVFFIIPWGFFFAFLPFIFYRVFSKRNLFLGLSFALLCLLGTGGTTPIPRMLLGDNAFSILTLERFTFWATIQSIPFVGEFLWRFFEGNIHTRIVERISRVGFSFLVIVMVASIFVSSGFTMNLSFFRPLQPDAVEMKPIINFLNSDKHDKWRFLTLGFGDQMALLSAGTTAKTIDGNYHSARRVPELTTRAVERLENCKYRGVDGIGTLQQFLAAPELFHLKFVFSNDQFYDPILYFSGWHRVKRLTNGVMVWERSDVSPLPSVLPKKDIPLYQKIWWGISPMCMLFFAFFCNVQLHWWHHVAGKNHLRDRYANPEEKRDYVGKSLSISLKIWVAGLFIWGGYILSNLYLENLAQTSPQRVVAAYYDALDFKRFEEAHSYLSEAKKVDLDQFLLEISVSDGLVESYGKLNEIVPVVTAQNDHKATVKVKLKWITALKSVEKELTHQLRKEGDQWYLVYEPLKNDVPTNQFFKQAGVGFYNQGRRTITTEESFHDDVLDRPVARVLESALVQRNGQYTVVGSIQNVDDYPTDLTVKATLYDSIGNYLTSYYDKFYIKHKLLPRETTSFRVDFEAVGWNSPMDSSNTFDPEAFNELKLSGIPARYEIEVLSTVATQDVYHSLSLNELVADGERVSGEVFNSGQHTATITQLLQGYRNKQQEILWVDHYLLPRAVFPRRDQHFGFDLADLSNLRIVSRLPDQVLVNGLENESINQKYLSADHQGVQYTAASGMQEAPYVSLTLNPFISNPSAF